MKIKPYAVIRVDTATRVSREALEAAAPGWGKIDTTRPLYAIVDGPTLKVPADWPLIDDYAEAVAVCASFNDPDDDGAHNEAVWQARMAGDMEAWCDMRTFVA